MLTNREAALLKGQWWECAEDGSEVWQRLSIKPAPADVIRNATEEIALARAARNLKRRRVELLMELERLKGRHDAVSAMPMARLLARKELATLQTQIAAQRKRLDELPQKPAVRRLDPDASCGVLADKTTKVIAEEVNAASPPDIPAIVPEVSWPPKPAPAPFVAAAPASVVAAAPVAPVGQPAADLHPDLHDLATQPFDESLLG